MPFLKPFKKYDLGDFPNVWIPLAEAARHSSAVAETNRRGALSSPLAGSDQGNTLEKMGCQESINNSDKTFDVECLRAEIEAEISTFGNVRVYDRKAQVINKALQDIGMGQYQWKLFTLCGFGWLADNLWLQGIALTLPSLCAEYGLSLTEVRYTTLALFIGLCIGASSWGVASDIIGRRHAFNWTLMISAVFGIAAGFAINWVQICALYAVLGFGIGGSLPVDGALFLEFLPLANGNLLTMLSIWWPCGQFISALIAWGFNTSFSCVDGSGSSLPACSTVAATEPCCSKSSNMGWRYSSFTMGGVTFIFFVCRFFLFRLFESPKFLLSRGRQREAVTSVRGVAYHNKCKTWLSEEILDEIGGKTDDTAGQELSKKEVLLMALGKFSTQHIKPLFRDKKLAINTGFLWFIWAAVGMGYPLFNAFLPQYLAHVDPNKAAESSSIVYRNYLIISAVGCPGSVLACWAIDLKRLGRKGTMAIATTLTSVFLFLFVTQTDAKFVLAVNCLIAFCQNIMYGVLYAYSPETFPAPNRGTGSGIGSFFNRIAGLCAPIIAIKAATHSPTAPVLIAAGVMMGAAVAMICLPIETRGRPLL